METQASFLTILSVPDGAVKECVFVSKFHHLEIMDQVSEGSLFEMSEAKRVQNPGSDV